MDAPLDNLVRALLPGTDTPVVEFRAADDPTEAQSLGLLHGHFCVYNTWTEIDSWYEGRFLERIAPGAAAKTISEHFAAKQPTVKILFDHGADPQIGNKVLGPVAVLEEDEVGVRYEVPLHDTSYNRDLLPGLTDRCYGASFRFRVIKDEWNDDPGVSEHNPQGLPERSITEFRLFEGGPVTFPAYIDATAGMRSLTDDWLARHMTPGQLDDLRAERAGTPDGAAVPATPDEGAGEPAEEPPAGHSERTTYTHAELLQRLATAL